MPGLLSPKLCGLDFDRRDPTAAFVLVKIRRLNHPRLVQQKNVHWRLEIVIQEFTVYVYEVPIHFSKQKTNDCPLPSRLCHRSPEGKEHTTQALGMKESKDLLDARSGNMLARLRNVTTQHLGLRPNCLNFVNLLLATYRSS